MAKEDTQAFAVEDAAEGDGKALVCCVGRSQFEAIRPGIEKVMAEIQPERLDAFLARSQAEGDGKALVCCVGKRIEAG